MIHVWGISIISNKEPSFLNSEISIFPFHNEIMMNKFQNQVSKYLHVFENLDFCQEK